MKDNTVKLVERAPSSKAKDDVTRISNLFVNSTIFYETLRLERFRVGIGFLVTSHAPDNTISTNSLAYLKDTRKPTINS